MLPMILYLGNEGVLKIVDVCVCLSGVWLSERRQAQISFGGHYSSESKQVTVRDLTLRLLGQLCLLCYCYFLFLIFILQIYCTTLLLNCVQFFLDFVQ